MDLIFLQQTKKVKYWNHETADLELVGRSPVHNTLAVCTEHEEQLMNQNQL